jgi:hypothetical protein
VESGPTASVCSAVLLAAESDGYGTQRIMSGLKYTRSSRSDGCMSMRAKRHGTTQGYIQKVRLPPTDTFTSSVD